jgi:hypothetical protein
MLRSKTLWLTLRPPFHAAAGRHGQKLRSGQRLPYNSNGLLGGIAVDVLVFEFMGLAILALCVIVLAVPSQQRPSRRISDT